MRVSTWPNRTDSWYTAVILKSDGVTQITNLVKLACGTDTAQESIFFPTRTRGSVDSASYPLGPGCILTRTGIVQYEQSSKPCR